jgi:predicted Zn-dependent peptidase
MINRDVLPNGVRIISETVPYVQSVAVGIWVSTGARDEDSSNGGISHFLEHMLFKGTETRSAKQIATEFDSIGGQVNAFTDKEYTCYFAKVLSEHLDIAVDVLADMYLNSVLDPKEMKLEKNVVLEEIKRHEDTPDELIHDVLAETVWNNHPLGNSIIGSRESVSGLTRSNLKEYIQAKYTPDCIIVSVAGNLAHDHLVDRVGALFGGLQGTKTAMPPSPLTFDSESALIDKVTEQVHFCVAAPGFSQLDNEKYTLAVIDTTLGGGMSSRLFQEIRESRGLAYAIGSYSAAYREGGMFAVYGGTSIESIEEVVRLVRDEFGNVLKENITDEELTRSKNQIKGALVLSQENMSSRMIRMAKSEIYHGRIIRLEELISSIMNVEHVDVARVSERIFAQGAFPVAAIGPFGNRKVVI